MLSWRKEKGGETNSRDDSPKTKAERGASDMPERKSRPVSNNERRENAATPTGPDNRRLLGEMLVSEGIVTQKQLDEALQKKEEDGGFVGQLLVELGHIRQNELISFLVKQCKIPHISLADYHISNELLSLVPEEICLEHGLLPIDKLGKILTVAMVDPLDAEALEAVREACPDLRIKPILCDWNHFAPACERLFSRSSTGVQQVTASSLGLSDRVISSPPEGEAPAAPDDAEKTTPAEESTPAEEPDESDGTEAKDSGDSEAEVQSASKPQPEPEPGKSPAAPVPSVNAEQVVAQLRDGMRDVLREVIASVEKTRSEAPAAPAPDYTELGKLMRESVEQGMAQSTATLLKGMQMSMEQAGEAKKAADKDTISPEQMADILRTNLEETMQKTVGELAKSLEGSNPKIEVPAGPSAEDLAKAVGSSIQEAMGTMAQEFSAVVEKEAKRGEDTQQALKALYEAFAGNKSADESQTERILEIAEAAKRAAETAEKAIEALKEAREEEAASKEDERRDNVHEFPGTMARKNAEADLEALDALDSPGLAARSNEQVRAALENEQPIPGYTFGDYIPGKTNELTFTLCKALAAGQVADLTPFYLYGGVGLGKSHLFNAIGNNIMLKNPDMRIGYVSAGMMARKFAKAMAEDHAIEFRSRYCDMDMLLIDDIHLLAQKADTQEEMLYLLDAFLHEERPILLAGNASPDKLKALDPCLASRLFSGVVSSVRAPEQAARVEILSLLAQNAQADVPEEIVKLIAMQIQDDMRKMTGALRKVIAYSRVSGHAIDKDLAGEVLSQLGVDAA